LQKLEEEKKTVYGPVKSWRFGVSLGIDPIFQNSICSFNCVYCQLGKIQKVTLARKIYVPTEKIIKDLKEFFSKNQAQEIDVITFSGSGEPTLAKNLLEIAKQIKVLKPEISLIILTNSTTIVEPEVKRALYYFDRVILKLDALEQKVFEQINQPDLEVNLEKLKSEIINFKKIYKGYLDFQLMFMPLNINQAPFLGEFINLVQPDFVYLNTPSRPVPLGGKWILESRGNLDYYDPEKTRKLKTLTDKEILEVQQILKSKLSNQKTYLNCIHVS